MKTEKIIGRVKKMMALGNDSGATEAERETALRMAYNLLAKYNLSLGDLKEEQEGREIDHITVCGDKWIRTACNQIAKLFFCNYFFVRTRVSGKEEHYFVGKISNVETARHMSEFIIKGIKKEATKKYGSPTSPTGRSFSLGAVNSIQSRVQEMLTQDVENTPGTSIVLYDLRKREEEENSNYAESHGFAVKIVARRPSKINLSAYEDGKSFGKNISLSIQVQDKAGE